MKRTIVLGVIAAIAAAALALGGCATAAQKPSTSAAPTQAGTTAAGSSSATSAPGQSPVASGQQPIPAEKNPPGDIPDNQAFVPYVAGGLFSVDTPEGWSRQESANGAEFTDKLNTIKLAWAPATAAPTVASVQSEDVPKLTASEPAFTMGSVKAVTLPAGPAVLLKYQANSAPNAVTGKQYRLDVERYTLFHNGQRVDVTLLSPAGADNVDPWKRVSGSLTWK